MNIRSHEFESLSKIVFTLVSIVLFLILGPHSFYKGQNVVKIRETQGLGIPGAPIKQYHLQHQPALDFGSQFSLQNDVYQNFNPAHNFIARPTAQAQGDGYFTAHNDEYTRNLVPPPFVPKKGKKPSVVTATESSTSKNVQFNVQKYTPQTFDVQFTPPHETQQQQFNPTKEKTVELQVTKEKLQVYHNTVPPNHNNFQQDFNDYRTRNQNLQTYEVTEGKFWQETPNVYRQQQFATAATPKKRPSLTELQPPIHESADIPFLPTPFQLESLPPTSPTQSEVSTIFTRLSLKQKAQATADPSLYDVKEVSTHYPILGIPVVQEIVTTEAAAEVTTVPEVVEVTEAPVVRQRVKQRRRRPGQRLRTTTEEVVAVTENYEVEKTVDAPPSRRPLRRRPIRYRTSTTTTTTTTPVEQEEEDNHQIYRKPPQRFRIQTTEEPATQEAETQSPDQATERTDDSRNEIDDRQEETTPAVVEIKTEEPSVTIRELFEETTLATTAATTTTTEAAVSKPSQTRRRPIKYDTSRPRFSVKEYRQRLNQYSSTSTTTTETPKTSSETTRTRFANRFRRPSTTTPSIETTESTRKRFEETIITDKPVKAVNTRLRPFGRYRSTTEPTTTTQKVSIRPYTFNSLRRPTPVSLRKRIYNKFKNNTEEATTTTTTTTTEANTIEDENPVDAELSETIETAVPLHSAEPEESSTEFDAKKLTDVEISDESDETTVTNDIMRNELILQRVSDLTSSAKDTPGLFKSVAPISRRVPSYFTIATEDPILPIETVFANIKEKDRSRF